MVLKKELHDVLTAYGVADCVLCVQAYGNGHINNTDLVTLKEESGEDVFNKLIIQTNTTINKYICPVEIPVFCYIKCCPVFCRYNA